MYIREETLDDLLNKIYTKLLKKSEKIVASKGSFKEITGVLLHLKKPRARLSRAEGKGKLFSCLGELTWYLAGSKDLKFISYYIPNYKKSSDDRKTVYGAYGPRLCGKGRNAQLLNVINILKARSTTRQAVIQLFDAKDILKPHKDIPCTCTLQFIVRGGKLDMLTSMRSNDAFLGLPHDIFAFTMIQEIVANSINCQVGEYKHYVGSLHLYEVHFIQAKSYLDGGWQKQTEMPPMPLSDPMPSLNLLLDCEQKIRLGESVEPDALALDEYWKDLVRVLQFFRFTKYEDKNSKVDYVLDKIISEVYKSYLLKRKAEKAAAPEPHPSQLEIFDNN